jgi:hypothetical protein
VLRHAQTLVSKSLVVAEAALRLDELLRESVLAINQNVSFSGQSPLVFVNVVSIFDVFICTDCQKIIPFF